MVEERVLACVRIILVQPSSATHTHTHQLLLKNDRLNKPQMMITIPLLLLLPIIKVNNNNGHYYIPLTYSYILCRIEGFHSS